MAYKLSFRIRRCYFDQIVAGTKDREVRARKMFWTVRAIEARDHLVSNYKVVAVFLCGKDVHRRYVTAVLEYPTAKMALGRDPS